MQLRLFTVLFRHTYPFKTWGDEPGYENYPEEVKRERIYKQEAGQPTYKVHLRVFAAFNEQEVVERCQQDACKGWGTQVLCIWEGVQKPIHCSDDVLTLSAVDEKEINRLLTQQLEQESP